MFKVGDVVKVTNPEEGYDKLIGLKGIVLENDIEYRSSKNALKVAIKQGYSYRIFPFQLKEIEKVNKNITMKFKKLLIVFNRKSTIVSVDDNKAVSTCSEEDHFDPVVGFCVAFTAATLFGGSKKKMKEVVLKEYKKQTK